MLNKKRILILTAVIIAVLIIGIIGISALVKQGRVNTLANQQSYTASKLIEMGDYSAGNKLALQSYQTKPNTAAKQLIVLAAGFKCDFELAEELADTYLSKGNDDIILAAKMLIDPLLKNADNGDKGGTYNTTYEIQQRILDDDTRSELMSLLLRVQNSIKVKMDMIVLQAMIDAYSSNGNTSTALAVLENDKSFMTKKIRTVFAIDSYNYEEAYKLAEELFDADSSFENRAMLANMVASGKIVSSNEIAPYDKELDTKLYELQTEINSAQQTYNQAYQDYYSKGDTGSGSSELRKAEQKLESLNKQYEKLSAEIYQEPAKRALNFIEATTPVTDKNSDFYRLQLAYLLYSAGEEDKADKEISKILSNTSDSFEIVTLLIGQMAENYKSTLSQNEREIKLNDSWDTITAIMNFIKWGRNYQDFYNYLKNYFEQYFHGMTIRRIDSTDFPTIRVTLNISADTEKKLKKNDFTLFDMGEKVGKWSFKKATGKQISEALTVMLVIDKSGSMGGTAMDDTKSAVINFIKNADADTSLGIVSFDQSAYLLAPVGTSQTQLQIAVDKIYADGGTDICNGLEMAGEAMRGISGRRIIILLSDGADSSTDRIDGELEKLRAEDITVYTIGFGGADSRYLSYIAEYCGGKYISADSSKLLTEIYASIGKTMTNDYIIEFTAKTEPDKYHRWLEVSSDSINVTAEKEYDVGVPYDKINSEENLGSQYGFFRQVGGSSTK